MEYIFGNVKLHGKLVHILKTVGDEHTNLTGANQIERKYSDCIITDEFVVKEKYLSKTDSADRCYDWYIITDHYRYIDYFTPMKEQIATDTADLQNALCDFSADLDELLADIENALCELTEE
jgi:hypothetical protein